MEKHKTKVIFIIVLILQIMVAALYMNSKQFMHVDELYSYEGAHNVMLYNFGDPRFRLITNDEWWNTWYTKEKLMEHYEVRGDESILNHSLSEIKDIIKKRNNFYILLNIVESFQSDPTMTKWSGFILNSIFFVLHQLVFYLIGMEIFEDKKKAMLPMILYGFSAGAISIYIYIRFYVLKSLCCLLIAYIHIKLLKWKNIWGIILTYVITGMAVQIIYGYQPYIIIYAASAVFVFMIVCLIFKEYKLLLKYMGIGCMGAIAVVLFVPAVVRQLQAYAASGEGVNAVNSFFRGPIRDYVKYCKYYFIKALAHAAGGVYSIAVIGIIIAAIWYIQRRKGNVLLHKGFEYLSPKACFMICVSICYPLVFCRIAFNEEYRYISCIYPGICLGIAILLEWAMESCGIRLRSAFISMVVLVGLFFGYTRNYVNEVYPEAAYMHEELAKYPNADNLYIINESYWIQYYRDSYMGNAGTRQYLMSPHNIDTTDFSFLEELEGGEFLCWIPIRDTDEEVEHALNQILTHTRYKEYEKILTTYECDVYYVY